MKNYSEEVKDKLKKFAAEPSRIFGLVYPYILTIILILGFFYVMHLNDSARQKVMPAIPDSTVQKELQVVQARTIPPFDLKKAAEPSTDLIEKGKAIYINSCSSCHNEQGDGKGPASTGLNPPPRNFTSKNGWKNGQKITQIFTTIQEGIPGTAMIAYELLTPEEKFGLAHYIRTTFVTDPPKDAPEDFATIDQLYGLSKGKEIPAQIPVAKAENFILAENNLKTQNFTRVMGLLSELSNDGGKLFSRITINKAKAVSALIVDQSWKGSEQAFINFVTKNINQNGFSGNVFNLKREEWNTVYQYISGIL